MPVRLPSLELGGYRLVEVLASASVNTGCDVLPWRPARGGLLLIEKGAPLDAAALVGVAGVAGAWRYMGTSVLHARLTPTDALQLTVCYLDDEPVTVQARMTQLHQDRWASGATSPLLSAPFEAVAPFAWDRSLSS